LNTNIFKIQIPLNQNASGEVWKIAARQMFSSIREEIVSNVEETHLETSLQIKSMDQFQPHWVEYLTDTMYKLPSYSKVHYFKLGFFKPGVFELIVGLEREPDKPLHPSEIITKLYK
jgi:hypothetical protein